MSAVPKLELDLVENAKDSLRHAVEHLADAARPTDHKFSVLHVFHAVELFLKAALSSAHPALVFKNPEEAGSATAKTVDYETLRRRLEAVGVTFTKEELDTLGAIRRERNKIEHFKVDLDAAEVQQWIGRALRFLEAFVEEQFDLCLEEVWDRATYKTLLEAAYDYSERVEKAQASLPGNTPDDYHFIQYLDCPECGEETIAYPDPEFADDDSAKVRCRFCDEESYVTTCGSCESAFLMNEPVTRENDPGKCQDCWDHIFSKDD